MPRPVNKTELLVLSKQNFEKLIQLVDAFTADALNRPFPEQYMNRNVKDVLAHLHQWHQFMLEWYAIGMAGKRPDMPAKGYTWKTLPELNRSIWEQYQNAPFEEVFTALKQSHSAVVELIQKHTNEELFEKKRYAWTGSTSLAAYLISATSSHYDWAYKLIKKCTSS